MLLSFTGGDYLDWLGNLINGIGDAIGNALSKVWDTLTSSIWDLLIEWIYNAVYNAIADFFTLMGQMGTEFFDLPWITACIRFFNLFGWGMFVAGLIVAVFDTAIEYQSMGRFNIKRQVMPFLYGFLAVNLFTVVPIRLYTFCITLQNTFAKELASVFSGYMGQSDSVAETALHALQVMSGMTTVFNDSFLGLKQGKKYIAKQLIKPTLDVESQLQICNIFKKANKSVHNYSILIISSDCNKLKISLIS